MDSEAKVVLIIGGCVLDRLLTVSKYPKADSKVATTSYHEMGGGNAANTATTMALLADASFLQESNIRIKFLTKVGDDHLGKQLTKELRGSGVDVTAPLYRVGKRGSSTSITTVVVSEREHTRTCMHTPGSSGELTIEDVESVNMDKLFANVVHLHCDFRHTAAALLLAKEARRRNLPVSVDAEKDRLNHSFDHLVEIATMIFTNSQQLHDYLARRTKELELHMERRSLPDPMVVPERHVDPDDPLLPEYARAIQPSFFFERLGEPDQKKKEVIITKGSMGALHVRCVHSATESFMEEGETDESYQEVVVRTFDHNVQAEQTVNEHTWGTMYAEMKLTYEITSSGVTPNPNIVDTTGAGDAFIGAYLLAQVSLATKDVQDKTQFQLMFGSWVAGQKLCGPGARSALPRGIDVDSKLGKKVQEVHESLRNALLPFGKS